MNLCRNCIHWRDTLQWRGNCEKHPWEKDRWSETTEPNQDCKGKDYIDKYTKYAEVKK